MKLELNQKEITEAIAEWINTHTEYEIAAEDIVLLKPVLDVDIISAVITVSVD